MTRTAFCDTARFHVLMLSHKRALAEGRQLRLVVPGTSVLRIFAITGIDRVIPLFASLDKALAQQTTPTTLPIPLPEHDRPAQEGSPARLARDASRAILTFREYGRL